MEWYEHDHDNEKRPIAPMETSDMSAAQRLAIRLANFFGVEHCCLTKDCDSAVRAAAELLFALELGERKLLSGDEVIVISALDAPVADVVSACGGKPISLRFSLDSFTVSGALLEAALSPATRAVWVEHAPGCPINLITVRNFCNKYDLWMIEGVGAAIGSRYCVDGTEYAVGAFGDWSYCDLALLETAGGVLLTRDALLAELLEGTVCRHQALYSANSEISPITGCGKLQDLPQRIARCRQNFDLLKNLWQPLGNALCLSPAVEGALPCCLLAVALCESMASDAIMATLRASGLSVIPLKNANLSQKNDHVSEKHRQNFDFCGRSAFCMDLDRPRACIERAAHAVREVLGHD